MDGLFYQLSQAADADLEGIFDYTEQAFSQSQAVDYLAGFETVFRRLLDNPNLGRERCEIRSGLRSIAKDGHIIFTAFLQIEFALYASYTRAETCLISYRLLLALYSYPPYSEILLKGLIGNQFFELFDDLHHLLTPGFIEDIVA